MTGILRIGGTAIAMLALMATASAAQTRSAYVQGTLNLAAGERATLTRVDEQLTPWRAPNR